MELNTNTAVTSNEQQISVSVDIAVNESGDKQVKEEPKTKPGAKRQAKYREKVEGAGLKQFNRSIPDVPEIRDALDELAQKTRTGTLQGDTLQKLVLLSQLDEQQIALLHDIVVSLKPDVLAS